MTPLAFPTRSAAAVRSDWAAALERSRGINAIPSAYERPSGKGTGSRARHWVEYPEASK